MLTYEFTHRVRLLLQAIRSQRYLFSILDMLSEGHRRFATAAAAATTSSAPYADEIRKVLADGIKPTIEQLGKVQVRNLSREMDEIENAIKGFLATGSPLIREDLSTALDRLASFSSAVEAYYHASGKQGPAILLVTTAQPLQSSLSTISDILLYVQSTLEDRAILEQENIKELSVLLETKLDFDRFARKLLALSTIYIELCNLFAVSPAEYPASVVKIESGSFWASIAGHSRIIDVMESVITRAASYIYRNFTREGKLVSIPRKVESIESIIRLRAELQKLEMDTTAIDEAIKKASIVVAAELARLLLGEPKITLNSKAYSVGKAFEQKFLEESKNLLLPEST